MGIESPERLPSQPPEEAREEDTVRTPEALINWSNITREVQELYLGLADEHLEEGSPLRAKIIDFYSDETRLQGELRNIFARLDNDAIHQKIDEVRERLSDRTLFVEHYQKIFERTDVRNEARTRANENPLATDAEYELGAYQESLEHQVRDACFALNAKGYKTFQSGFREGDGDRDQYIDVYNKNVQIPDELVERFQKQGFEVSVNPQDDRTTILIHPQKAGAVTLEEWKRKWDELAAEMHEAQSEDFSGIKTYGLHSDFREKQDVLRRPYHNRPPQ